MDGFGIVSLFYLLTKIRPFFGPIWTKLGQIHSNLFEFIWIYFCGSIFLFISEFVSQKFRDNKTIPNFENRNILIFTKILNSENSVFRRAVILGHSEGAKPAKKFLC